MKLSQFNLLDESEQVAMLLEDGVLVAERFYKEFTILLYQLRGFYVEVYYHKTYEVIQGFRSFENLSSLDPFLAAIDISPVYS